MKTKLLILLFLASLSTYAQTNLVPNGNFETWTSSSQPDNWFRYFSGFASQSTSAQNGTSSTNMMIADGTFNFINSQFFPVVANKTYRVTLYHKLVSGSFSAIDLSLYHKPGTFKEEIIKKTDATFSSSEWRKIEFDYTPTVSENIEVDIWTTGALNSEILVDNVSVIDVATIGAQYTLIPDVNFEKKLIALGIDSGATDGKVLTSSINKLTSLDVVNSSISDLTGIQDFVALVTLECFNNPLTSLDVSKNLALKYLGCVSTQLTTLDISKNVALTNLYCSSKKLTSLNLKNGKNTLIPTNSINITGNPNLRCILVDDEMYANTNWSTKKDTSAFYSSYDCSTITPIPDAKFEDKLITLGFDTDGKNGFVLNSSIASITTLDVSNSAITDLKGIESFTALTNLNCSGNQLKKLDLSKNTAFTTLNCINNPTLVCIQVSNLAAAANWATTKDATASFSLDCTIYTLIPDAQFEDKLIALDIDKDGKNGKVATESIAKITSLDASNSNITDLTGIQDFVALTYFYCDNNQLTTLDVSQNVALTYLYCNNNKLTTLDVSKNVALTTLYCYENQLTTLDVSKNVALTTLYCYKNQLSNLDTSKNLALTILYCSSNLLNSLDISKNLALNKLSCGSNQINNLDVSKHLDLKELFCSSNLLTTLDVSKNTALTVINCDNNNLTSLNIKNGNNSNFNIKNYYGFINNPNLTCITVDDLVFANANWADKKDPQVSFSSIDCSLISVIPDPKFEEKLIALKIDTDGKNGVVLNTSIAAITSLDVSNSAIADLTGIQGFTALTTLNCSGNLLKKLDLSKNMVFSTLNCSNNPTLICIQVANVADAGSWATTKDATASFSLDCTIYTLIPDANFEDRLIALGIDRDGKNGKVTTERIAYITSLNVSNNSIADLTGIQDFLALETLYCSNNKLTTLDVSKLLALNVFNCSSNDLATIDVSKNTKLAYFGCTDNLLTSLGVSKNSSLKTLDFERNNLTNIDVSNNLELQSLNCSQNPIISLDVTKNKLLNNLQCSGSSFGSNGGSGRIATLNLSNNTELNNLNFSANQIEIIDLSSNNKIQILRCYGNILKSLDISKNTTLTELSCSYNKLKSVNFKNGNNTKATYINFTSNPSLSCIQVDDVDYSNNNWATKKDVTASFSTDCAYSTAIPDSKFEDKLIALGIDTDGKNGKVLMANIANLTSLDVSNAEISDLTGIEAFTALQSLSCNNNGLPKIDLSKNIYLASLNIAANKLTMLNVVNNSKLQTIHCNDNLLRTLDFSKNTSLTEIYCPNNKLISLNLKNGNNAINNGPSIKNFTSNPDLSCIQVDDVNYSNTNWPFYKDATASYSSDCAYSTLIPDAKFEDKLIGLGIDTDGKNGKVLTANIMYLTNLDVSSSSIKDLTGIQDFVSLKNLNCKSNLLTSIDVSKNADLITLDCYSNDLLSIDLSKNTNLTSLNLDFNETSNLNVTNNLALTSLSCYYNLNSALDISKNTALTYLDCSGNPLAILDVSKNVSLTYLATSYSKLTSLDVSKNKVLTTLNCGSNYLTNLDVSNNIALTKFNCSYNKLQTLNLKNSKNNLIDKSTLSLSGNPNLYCILVDDVAYSNTNWATNKDATASFNSVECKALSLPVNNFNVESKGETCLNSNNGEINITATANYDYKAKINAGSYTFTNNSLKVPNLAPGTYTVIITIPGETFEQSFSITIPKGATITGKSSVAANKVSIEITEGTAPYTVFVDGVEQFETTDTNFTVETKKGGLLQVKTAKACEGIYAKDIASLDGVISAYPNPTSGSFEIEMPSTNKEVVITLYTLDAQMVSTKTYTVENGKAQLTLENQPAGVYVVKIELDTPDYLKIIKN